MEEVYPLCEPGRAHRPRNGADRQGWRHCAEQSVPAALHGGQDYRSSASEFYLGTDRENFGGILVDGDSDYTVNNARIEMSGMGLNDFVGMGAGVAAPWEFQGHHQRQRHPPDLGHRLQRSTPVARAWSPPTTAA